MTKEEKLLEKFLENPESISLNGLIKIIESQGFIKNDAKGSHIRFTKKGENQIILAIHNNDIKFGYRTRICKRLFQEEKENLEEEN